jgi:hypothetical protein
MMKKILRSWGFPLALVCFGASTAWAAFGPCNITRPGVFNTTIGCYGRFVPFAMECHCGGMAAIRPEHSACANANAIPCTEILVESIILFRSDGSDCSNFGLSCGGICFIDLTTRTRLFNPPGTNCNAMPPVNPNPPTSTTTPVEQT